MIISVYYDGEKIREESDEFFVQEYILDAFGNKEITVEVEHEKERNRKVLQKL